MADVTDLTTPSSSKKNGPLATNSMGYEAATGKHRAILYWLALPILLIDQLSKWWVVENMPLNTQFVPIPALFPYFKFTHIANTGAVFGTLQNARLWLTILAIIVAIGLVIYNQTMPMASRKLRVALGLVFGGAIGNLIDRIRFGHVTDFVDLDFTSVIPLAIADWYIWNIADLAIVCAIILMAYLTFFEPEQIEVPEQIEATADDVAGVTALELLAQTNKTPADTTVSIDKEFQSAAEVASIKTETAHDEALDMLDLSDAPSSATEIVDIPSKDSPA